MHVLEASKEDIDKEVDAILGKNPDDPNYATSQLSAYMASRFDRNERAKQDAGVKDKLILDLRQYEGLYDHQTLTNLARQGGTLAYNKITMMKCDTLDAWINFTFEGLSENRVWDIKSTPNPTLPPEIKMQLAQEGMMGLQQMMDNADPANPPTEEVLQNKLYEYAVARSAQEHRILKIKAEDANDNMKRTMRDQQIEGGYRKALKHFVKDYCVFKNAFMKGPFIKYKKKLTYGKNWEVVVKSVPTMTWEVISPFDMFPDPSAKTINDGDLFERVRYSRADLEAVIGIDGYHDESINFILGKIGGPDISAISDGAATSNDDERGFLEQRSWDGYSENSDGYVYKGVNFYGSVPGYVLQDWDIKGVDVKPSDTYEINAIMIGATVIKAILNPHPLGKRPYTTASYKPIPGAIWGTSLPEVLRDVQKAANSTFRALLNNLSIASGPQVVIDIAQLPTGSQITGVQPWKIWQIDSRGNPTSNKPGINFVDVPSNAAELIGVLDRLEQNADEVSQIPKFAHGSTQGTGPAGSTATGMSIVQSNATKGMRNVIREITVSAIKPHIEMQYDWNMINNPDTSIKGDAQVDVGGPIAMIEKEALQAKRLEFLQITNNELDFQLTGTKSRAMVLRKLAEGLDLDPKELVKTNEMIDMDNQRAAQQEQQNMAMAKAAQDKLDLSQNTQDMTKLEAVHVDKTKVQLNHELELIKIAAGTENPKFNLEKAALDVHDYYEMLVPEREAQEMKHLQVMHPEIWRQLQELQTSQEVANATLDLEELTQQGADMQGEPGPRVSGQQLLAGGVR